MKNLLITLFLYLSLILNNSANSEVPPPLEIYQNINSFWKAQEFDSIENYLNEVLDSTPNYIPATVAKIEYLTLNEGQYREALELAHTVSVAMEKEATLVSPSFYDLFKSYITRLESSSQAYVSRGIDEKKLQEQIHVQNHWRSNSSWGQELLFLSAPYSQITEKGLVYFELDSQHNEWLNDYQDHELQEKLFDLGVNDAEHKQIAIEFIERYLRQGMDGVVQLLSHPTSIVTANYILKGFWDIIEDLPNEEILGALQSNPLVFEKTVLWLFSNPPPNQRFRSKDLLTQYLNLINKHEVNLYGQTLQKAMKTQSAEAKYGQFFNNKGRPNKDISITSKLSVVQSKFKTLQWIIGIAILVSGLLGYFFIRKAKA